MAKKPVKKPAKKTTSKPVVARTEDGQRLRKLKHRQQIKKEKSVEKSRRLPSAFKIMKSALMHLYNNKLFGGILLVYGILYIVLVKGVSTSFQLGTLKSSLTDTFGGKLGGLSTGVALYGLLLGSASSGSTEVSGAYQTVLVIIVSLALIWTLRSTYEKAIKLRVRDSFYKGMTPLVPFMAVALVIFLQLLPALIAASLFSVLQNGIAIGPLQQTVAIIFLILGLFWSFYMLSSSVFALYIVTLTDAQPIAALKAARKLVRFKRVILLRKVLFLPLVLLLFSGVILIPLILIIPVAAEVLFMLFSVILLGVVHSYLYALYRSLL